MTILNLAIIIAGPTAIGKTAVGIEVSKRLGGEIISADARQVYEEMPIGTCAPIDPEIKHHLVGYISPNKTCTAFNWAKLAVERLNQIQKGGGVPVIIGGTGLYIKALTEGIFEAPKPDVSIRLDLEARLNNGENLFSLLTKLDSESASKIHPNNHRRVIRALEVYYSTGKSLSDNFEQTYSPASNWRFLKFFLNMNREQLYHQINKRVGMLLDGGWIDETRELMQSGFDEKSPGMSAIGYREIMSHLRGDISYDELKADIAKKTRNYAKRQITWFSNRAGFLKIDLSRIADVDCIDRITEEYHKIL
ncbi:tRNA (adenosine(37)-N6)-dimethylallyltransferase MiaA [bacterium]|nr:tRNA (adenosine(37)-N6)-dimethylallyltransferase MiaA [bacterium]